MRVIAADVCRKSVTYLVSSNMLTFNVIVRFARLSCAISLFCLFSLVASACCLLEEARCLLHHQWENLNGKAGQDIVRFLLVPKFSCGPCPNVLGLSPS